MKWAEFYCVATPTEVTYASPMSRTELTAKYPSIVKLCFPEPVPYEKTSASFTTILTDSSGTWLYVHISRSSEGNALCLASSLPWSNVFLEVLQSARIQLHGAVQAMCVPHVVEVLLSQPRVPERGTRVILHACSVTVPTWQYPLAGSYIAPLLSSFDGPALVHLYSALFSERRVLVVGSSIDNITQTVLAIVSLLYPMRWCNILIPMIASGMEELAAAPMPYIIGCHSTQLYSMVSAVSVEDTVTVVDTRNGIVSTSNGEVPPMPHSKSLAESLTRLRSRGSVNPDDVIELFTKHAARFLHGSLKCHDVGLWSDATALVDLSKDDQLYTMQVLQKTQMYTLWAQELMDMNSTSILPQMLFLEHAKKLSDGKGKGWKQKVRDMKAGMKSSSAPPLLGTLQGNSTASSKNSPSTSPAVVGGKQADPSSFLTDEVVRLRGPMCNLNDFRDLHTALSPFSTFEVDTARHMFTAAGFGTTEDSSDDDDGELVCNDFTEGHKVSPEVAQAAALNIFAQAALRFRTNSRPPKSIDELFRPVPYVAAVPTRPPPPPPGCANHRERISLPSANPSVAVFLQSPSTGGGVSMDDFFR
eukprot:PhM_4_TR15388/c0_g1_i1/m.56045/K20160/DENND1; DENN domain-containing protein 1